MIEMTSAQYDEEIRELYKKNIMGSTKIETLYGKVRKSREKIDQVLNDFLTYQKEFESILIIKKCRPVKLRFSRKIMETRLDCYKKYLLHLQSVIEGLEREIRGFRIREKEHKKNAKIAGVGVLQKHNTYADQLRKKIAMLETQIAKDLRIKMKEGSPGKKSKSIGRRKNKKNNPKQTNNLATNLKNAKEELKDRDDQLNLLRDMLRSSTQENSMKDKEIERLSK